MRWNLLSYKGRSAKKNWTACVRGGVLLTSLPRLLSWFFAKKCPGVAAIGLVWCHWVELGGGGGSGGGGGGSSFFGVDSWL
jgi:hypothetical protein